VSDRPEALHDEWICQRVIRDSWKPGRGEAVTKIMESKKHYEALLGPIYSWMAGGFDTGLERNARFFGHHDLSPTRSGLAVDLGAGCGFQSIPLAQRGYSVTAIDTDGSLLQELKDHADALPVTVIEDDLCRFRMHISSAVELVVCMVDTLLHLASGAEVQALFSDVHQALEDGGRFIVTFRDLSCHSFGSDRFIPVRSDDDMILTCFLEYEPETVLVHDLLYRSQESQWQFSASCYRKLRLSENWVVDRLRATGFEIATRENEGGMVTIIAQNA
jgi:SAM-dependent methyltransferase